MEYIIKAFPLEEAKNEGIWIVEYYPSEEEKYVVEFSYPSYKLELCAFYIHGMMKYMMDTFSIRSSIPSSSQNTGSLISAFTIGWEDMKQHYGFYEETYPLFGFSGEEIHNDNAFMKYICLGL